jgi:hypothetical protein
VPKTIGFSKSVGRQHRIDSSDNCSESDKEDSRGTLNKGISSVSINWRRSCELSDVKDKLSPNVREFELQGRS